MDEQVVDTTAPAEEQAPGDGAVEEIEQPAEGPQAYISLTVRLSPEDHASLEKLAHFAHQWGIIKRPSLAEIIRFGLILTSQHLKLIYLKKKQGG